MLQLGTHVPTLHLCYLKNALFSTNDMHIIFPSMLLTYEVHFETKSPKYFGFTVCTGASMDMASARNVKTKYF